MIPFSFLKILPAEHVISSLPTQYAAYWQTSSSRYLFSDVSVIPMTHDTILPHQFVWVEGGSIRSISDTVPSFPDSIPYVNINAAGKFLLPGLADMHIHLNDESHLLLFLSKGITTVRNMSGYPFHLKIKRKLAEKQILGPNFFTTSPILEGSHQIWRNTVGSKGFTDPDSAAISVKYYQSQGYDFIKVYHTLEPALYKVIAHTADQLNIPVTGHLPIDLSLQTTLSLPPYSIEHIDIGQLRAISSELSLEEKARMIGQSGKWFCPTLIVYKKINGMPGIMGLSREYEKYIDTRTKTFWMARLTNGPNEYELRKSLVKTIYDHGGKIMAGTDAVNPYVLAGFSLHEELVELNKVGLSPYEVLKTATVHPAMCLGSIEQSGTIEVGKIADLLLINANPLLDISQTCNLAGVMIRGTWLNHDVLEQMKKEVKESH